MIPDVVGVSQRLEDFVARRALRRLAAGAQGRIHLDQSPFNRAAELVPALLGRPSGIARPDAGEGLFCVAVVGPGGGELPQFRAREQGDRGRRVEKLSSFHGVRLSHSLFAFGKGRLGRGLVCASGGSDHCYSTPFHVPASSRARLVAPTMWCIRHETKAVPGGRRVRVAFATALSSDRTSGPVISASPFIARPPGGRRPQQRTKTTTPSASESLPVRPAAVPGRLLLPP